MEVCSILRPIEPFLVSCLLSCTKTTTSSTILVTMLLMIFTDIRASTSLLTITTPFHAPPTFCLSTSPHSQGCLHLTHTSFMRRTVAPLIHATLRSYYSSTVSHNVCRCCITCSHLFPFTFPRKHMSACPPRSKIAVRDAPRRASFTRMSVSACLFIAIHPYRSVESFDFLTAVKNCATTAQRSKLEHECQERRDGGGRSGLLI